MRVAFKRSQLRIRFWEFRGTINRRRKHDKCKAREDTESPCGGSLLPVRRPPLECIYCWMESSYLLRPYSLFLPSPSHPRGHLKFTYDKQTEPLPLSLSFSFSLGYAYPPYIVASRTERHTYPYLQREYSFQFVHALGKRAVPPVCRHVNLQLARMSRGEAGVERDAQGETRDNLNHVAIYLSRESGHRRIELVFRCVFVRSPLEPRYSHNLSSKTCKGPWIEQR